MPIPPNAKQLTQPLDPSDIDFYGSTLTIGDPAIITPPPLLLPGEAVASFTLSPTAEAIAAGLQIKTGGAPYPAPTIVGLVLVFWIGGDPTMQGSTIFSGDGVKVGLELTITTNSVPPRVKQRTLVVTMANQ